MGIIDNNGNIIIPTEYDFLYYYSKETIKAKRNGKYGVLNSRNEIIIPLEYDLLISNIDFFELDSKHIDRFISKKNNIWYYFDTQGKLVREGVPLEEFISKYSKTKLDLDFEYIKTCMTKVK